MPAPAAFRIVLATLMLVAVALRMAVPTGWMPHRGADGVRLVLCSGFAPAAEPAKPAAHRGHHAEPDAPEEPAAPEQPCSFAAIAAAIAEPWPTAPAVVPSPAAAPVVRPLPSVAVGRGLAAPPPPATGPPLRA